MNFTPFDIDRTKKIPETFKSMCTDIVNVFKDFKGTMETIGIDVSGNVADMLGWNQKDESALNKTQQKWVENFKTSLKKRQTEIYKLTYNGENIQNKKYATQTTAKEQITKYNQLLTQLKSTDPIVSGQANDGIQQLIDKLKDSNSQLSDYISNARDAVKSEDGSDDIEKLDALNDENFMASQRKGIKEILSSGNVRQVIEEYSALATKTGKVSDEQRVMLSAIRGTDDELARFLEQNPTATVGQYRRSLIATTAKTMALELATTALNTAISFGLSLAISAAIAGVTAWIRKYDDLREANKEIVDQFKQTSDSIQEQIDKIKEYKKVLEDRNSTETEAYDARSGLIDVQKELIDTYGEEAKKLDLVNGKREEEIKKLEELERKKAETAYDDTFGSYEDSKKKLGKKRKDNFWGNYSIGTDGEIIGNYYQRIRIDDQDLNKKIEALGFVNNGYSIRFADKVTDTEAIDKFYQLISLIDESTVLSKEIKDKFRSAISDKISKIDTDDYQALLTDVENTSWLAIRKDEKLYGKYSDIENAIKEYDEAIASNDKSGVKTALDTIEKLRNEIENMEFDDQYIKQHFIDAIDEVQHDLDKRSLKVKIETVYNEGKRNETSYLNNFKQVFDGYSDLDVQNIPLTNSTEEEKKAYKELQAFAEQYELSVEDVIDVLVDLGIVFSRDADAAKYTTTNYASMLEEVEKTTEGLDKFVSAQEKIISGSALTGDEINELIKLYPQLVSSVERTANGYTVSAEKLAEARSAYIKAQKDELKDNIADSERQLKNIQYELAINQAVVDELSEKAKTTKLTDEEQRKLNTAKSTVENRLEAEKDTTLQLEQQKFLLEQIISPLEDYASKFNDVASKAENITDKINQMKANQKKTGALDPSDVLDFISEVPDWQNYIDLNNGKFELKNTSSEALREQIKETSGYNALLEEVNGKIKERNELQEKINNIKAGSVNSPADVKLVQDMYWELGLLNDELGMSETELEALGKVLDVLFKKLEKAPALTEFENAVAELNHKKSLGMDNDSYASKYSDIAKKYRNDLQELADKGDTDALSKLWEIDEQIYQNDIDSLERHYDKEKALLDNALEDKLISYLTYQKELAALNEKYYGSNSKLGKSEDGQKQYESNLREIKKLSKDAYDDLLSRLDSAVDYGMIIDPNLISDIEQAFGGEIPETIKQSLQKALSEGTLNETDILPIVQSLGEKLLTGADLTDAANDYKSRVTSAFEYEKEQLDNQLEAGLISSDDYIDEYTKLWEKYYKDKKEFAKEDLQTQKDILEAYKSEIQKQIDGLDAMSELQTQPYQDEIDALNDVQDEYDKMMDKRIKALNKEKEKLEEQNKEREKANDIQDKYLAMQKASVKKYIVLTNHGWEAQADSEEYEQAKKEYEDAKQDSVTDAIEKQIDALEKEKEARDESIQTEIEEREKQIKQIETPINNLTRVLTALLAQQYNLDPDFIAQLLSSADGTTALEALNKKMSFSQSQASAAGVDVPDDTLTTSDAQRMVDGLAEENNRTTEEAAKNIGLDLNSSNSTAAETTKSSNATAPQSDEVTKLIAEWNAFYAELQKVPSNYGEKGHEGNVDINHRTSVVHDTDGNYGTIYGSTLTYSDLADLFEQYLVSQEKQGKIISEDIWVISESLWQKADQHPDGAFNVSPFKPDGKSVVDLNSEAYEDDLYNYLISQLAKGIKLENMDIFMGGDYTTVDEADAAAQKAHEDSAELYKKGAEILTQLLLQGYDINQLQGAAYDGEVIKTNTQATEALTEEMKKSNDNAEKQNADSKSDNNKTKDITVGGYNLVADPKTGKLTKKPVTINGEPVEGLGHKVNATTKAEHNKHKSDYQKALESGTFTGSFADYMRQQRARKKGIVPITEATGGEAKIVAQAIQAFTRSADILINSNIKTNQLIEPADVVQVNTQPAFNCTINIEGSADEKTVEKFRSVCENEINGYFQYLNNTMNSAFVKSRYSK